MLADTTKLTSCFLKQSITKKRKAVRFSCKDTVRFTHSAAEYDRSSMTHTFYTFRPPPPVEACKSPRSATVSLMPRPRIAPLDLSIVPNASRRTPAWHTPTHAVKTKPKLQINTESIEGPSFFTRLSTHYRCFDEDEGNSFLVSIASPCPPTACSTC
ncbi:uncharacterized protein BYT42DRAFT_551346 [Radiomyces spectabilis]|uniref:uncharacterized protein n=1 Tax=Radiomyces spectabilis TaxID=64574 RepID=UPI0022204797|nr:uncharacterized protein BYT42DRAFT_551346 [Radiomyces spectabilis]KAI8393523.1 hypothetical protein BYT42DRAFT_551346 [Radiomyces spectabilis]